MATPSISVTIGSQVRLYHAFATTAPADLDAPSTMTLYEAPLADVLSLAADFTALDAPAGSQPGRLILVDGTELEWQRARYRETPHVLAPVHPVLVGLSTLQQWLWQRLHSDSNVGARRRRTAATSHAIRS